MQDLKFFSLFRTLGPEEVPDFRKHLKKMHGKDAVAITVFDYIRTQPDEKKLGVGYMCRRLYKDETPRTEKNLLNTLSDLHLWLKEFLLFKNATNGSFAGRLLWLNILQERKMEEEFLKQASPIQMEVANLNGNGVAEYMKSVVVNHLVHYSRPPGKLLPSSSTLLDFKNDLDVFCAVAQLKVACELANLKKQRPHDTNLADLDLTLTFAMTPALQQHPLFLVYQELYLLITKPEDERYTQIVSMLSQYAGGFDPSEAHTLLSHLHNYSAVQIRNGKEEFWDSTHQLNKLGVNHGVFKRQGGMSATQFLNIVTLAARSKDFIWTDSFLSSHITILEEAVREDTEFLANMIIAFEKREFKKIIQKLKPRDFNALLDNIRSRGLIMRTLYELGEDDSELLEYVLIFESFLRRHRQAEREAVKGTLNALQVIKMLIRRKAKKEKIRMTVEGLKPIYFKRWLLEKWKDYPAND